MSNKTKTNIFEPKDLTAITPLLEIPYEQWTSILLTPCTFSPTHFLFVMENLIKNPNITSSCVFRADIFYDSTNDTSINNVNDFKEEHFSKFTQHMKLEYRPLKRATPTGFRHEKTVVRQMVPRNPQLDRFLVQTCHFYEGIPGIGEDESLEEEKNLLVMIPHEQTAEDIPYYHPKVHSLALLHAWNPSSETGVLSIHYNLFPSVPLESRLQRTALNLLKIIHKHGTGQAAGYEKRVHHDIIVPQAAFQNTYTRLKAKYAKDLIGQWVEQTDPEKHVFEDLGIAAFLIELWREMYEGVAREEADASIDGTDKKKPSFPGFVDIGCGNGVLVNVLLQEGYPGWGFDARKRMTWACLTPGVQSHLKEMLLVPEILEQAAQDGLPNQTEDDDTPFHNGLFPQNTFIISNHADELTPWTPLLAYLSNSPFIAIPCCSHSLTGARCRFNGGVARKTESIGPGPATGSLARPTSKKKNGKQISAYQGLTAYVADLAGELGFEIGKEMLRIPSTRNAAIVGRVKHGDPVLAGMNGDEDRREKVMQILEREVGDLELAGKDWVERARRIAVSKGNCH
ncbi:DUF1613-domain-containing protein [Tothia fuscella]|uniref:tRNA (uracil-O(2)-)-methyltransferase n=1 Tax=Tothia fuscella TaxID=1048955 RepID=A0A9P4NL22_9PEZI|nr:DUF1613-domain-containing protein [Tothia fuscella]